MIRRPPSTTRTDTLFPYTTLFRSHLCKVERVESVGLGIRIGHDLDREYPAWKGPLSDSLEEVAAVEVSVGSSHGGGLVVGEERHALLGVEVIFYPEFLASGVHPHIRMRTVAVHVAPGTRQAALAHHV